MRPFPTNRAKRHTTFVALLVWLFALASGMANACLLVEPGKHAHDAASHSFLPAHTHADHALADHAGAAANDDDDDDNWHGAKESCLKACDGGSNAPVKLQASPDLLDPGLACHVVFAWPAMTPVDAVPSRFDDVEVPVAGPPFRVRYARLTL